MNITHKPKTTQEWIDYFEEKEKKELQEWLDYNHKHPITK